MARESYHHGNLRQALVDATARLIAEKGPAAFTLAEAARLAGVSAAAPYRHFTGRDQLLEEVARQGFVDFAARLDQAFDNARPKPLTAFMRLGRAYLDFARDRPGHYVAMFESGLSIAGNADLAGAANLAETVLATAARTLSARLPERDRPPPSMVANHIWAMSHGVVELFGRGHPGARTSIPAPEMLESAMLIYLRGLGLVGD